MDDKNPTFEQEPSIPTQPPKDGVLDNQPAAVINQVAQSVASAEMTPEQSGIPAELSEVPATEVHTPRLTLRGLKVIIASRIAGKN